MLACLTLTKVEIIFRNSKFLLTFAFMNKIVKISLISVVALMAFSCGTSYKDKVVERNKFNAEKQRKEKAALKIATLPTIDCLPIWVAQENGYLKAMPDSFIVKEMLSQIDIEHALQNEEVDVGASDLKRLENVNKKDSVLFSIGNTNLYWLLIANKSSRVSSPEKLGDKMVAMTRFSATDWLTDCVIEEYPHQATTFKIQINDVLIRLQMLLNNAMDAMWLPEPYATTAKMKGHKQLVDSRKYASQLATVAVRCNDLKSVKRMEQFQVFVNAYNRACDSLNKNGLKQYESLMLEHMPTNAQTLQKMPNLTFNHLRIPENAQ